MRRPNERSDTRSWLVATALLAFLYSGLALRHAFRFSDLVQDDARQHVFWMERFRDSTLFPNDWIADYFQAVAPVGYKALYWIFARAGVDPILLSKILPAVLGLITAWLAFQLGLRLLGNARAAFFASAFVLQIAWLQDDIVSATPRAFAPALCLGFFLCLTSDRRWLPLFLLALGALFYPQAAFLCLAYLGAQVLLWREGRLCLSHRAADYILFGAGILICAALLLPFAHSLASYGPLITRAEAFALPEFHRGGRVAFFTKGFEFWLYRPLSGFFPNDTPPHFVLLALTLSWLWLRKKKETSFLNNAPAAAFFLQLGLAGTGLWLLAHLFLFHLHLPGRYSQNALRLMIPIAAAMACETWLGATLRRGKKWRPLLVLTGLVFLAIPHLTSDFPDNSYLRGEPEALFTFLRAQPKNIVVASLYRNASLVPVFAQRSVLVSAEHAVPYHLGYYQVERRRGQDLLHAHLTSRPEELRDLLENYRLDFLIVARTPITPEQVKRLPWYRDIARPEDLQEPISPPILVGLRERAIVWENHNYLLLDVHRLLDALPPHGPPL